MAVQRGTHLSADVLEAFALGKLNDSSADVVMNHLDSCPDCCKQVAALSGDDFLNRLRQARSDGSTSTPGKTVTQFPMNPKKSSSQPAPANLPPELAANQQYEILRELGRGGMGVVYLAKNKLMDRLEVLKVVNKALLDHPGAVERFLREIRSAAKLSHANVVGAYHALQMGELLAFAMEYVEGQDLASLVKSQGPLPIVHACYYVQQAAMGLQHAYEKGMVHRDIKPQNLILAREGKKHIVKVLDFGLAKVMREKSDDTGLTGEGKMLGTPDYIAPEQTLDAAKADIRADIYSLGCTLYYLLSGHPPFSATSLGAILVAHQMHEARPLNLERPEVPEELAAIVRKMMAKSPAKRYQTPAEVVQALGTLVKQGATPKASPELSVGATEAKPAVKIAARVDPPPAPAAAVPKQQPEPAAVWESLTESSAASIVPRKSAIVRKPRAATVRERRAQKKWLIGGGIAVGVLLLALLGMWAGGVFKVKTADGTLIVEVSEPNPEVLVDGKTVTVAWHNGGRKAEISVPPGTHKVEVRKDGFSMVGKELTFKDGDREIFTARLLPEQPEQSNKPEEKVEANPPVKASTTLVAGKPTDRHTLSNERTPARWPWKPVIVAGVWRIEGDELVVDRDKSEQTLLLSDLFLSHYDLKFKAKATTEGTQKFCAVFHHAGKQNECRYKLANWKNTLSEIVYIKDGNWKRAVGHRGPLELDRWYDVRVSIRGGEYRAYLDGVEMFFCRDQPLTEGRVGLGTHHSAARFKDIEVTDPQGKVLWKGLPDLPKQANAATEDKGFVLLFNGKDLSGWSVDGGIVEQWSVEGDALVGNSNDPSTRSYLLTDKEYANFVLRFDFKVEDGNHGVAIRADKGEKMPLADNLIFDHPLITLMNPAIPAKDTKEPTGTTHWLTSTDYSVKPSAVFSLPSDTWHSMEIVVQGDNCTATIANKQFVNVTLDRFARNKKDFVPGLQRVKGKVGFQASIGTVRFRKIEIKELPPTATSSEPPKPATKQNDSFFNEKDLTGWDGLPGYWQAKFGCIVGEPPPGQKAHTFLCSKKHYRDFDLKFRVKREGGVGNSGVQFRSQIKDMSRFTVQGPQCEIDTLNHAFPPGSLVTEPNGIPLKVKPSAAALAKLAKVYKEGDFNDFHIRCVGKHVTIKVNDVTTVDDDFPSLPEEGIIAWQLHGGRVPRAVWFRIVEFTDLSASASADGFVPLFNGKNKTGWKTHPDNPGDWRVDNGILIGRGPTPSLLFTEKDTYSNFHLRVEVRINSGGDSGLCFRLPMFDYRKSKVKGKGYEAQINNTAGKGNYPLTGSLMHLPATAITDRLIPPGEWFTLEVLAQGNHLIIWLDGKKTVDFVDPQQSYRRGHLAVQVLDRSTVVEFRKIEIKELK